METILTRFGMDSNNNCGYNVNDAKLIENFCAGNIDAFNQLVERWQGRIHRLAYRYFASHNEAAEITQKTFIKAYKKIDSLDDPTKFSSWIYRIGHNLCLDESKRAGRRHTAPLEAVGPQPVLHNSADRSIQQKELGSILQMALKQLPPEQRMVVILKEYEGLKFREIAEILQEPESTIKSRMYYGLRSLRKIFNRWNIEMEELL